MAVKIPPASQFEKSIPTTGVLLVPADDGRKALVIGSGPTNFILLSLGKPAAAGEGIRIPAASPALVLSLALHGGIVRGPIYALSDTAAQVVTIWESKGDAD